MSERKRESRKERKRENWSRRQTEREMLLGKKEGRGSRIER